MHLKIIVPDDSIIKRAINLSVNLKLSYYDSIYVALAQEMRAPLITKIKNPFHSDKNEFIKSLDYLKDIFKTCI